MMEAKIGEITPEQQRRHYINGEPIRLFYPNGMVVTMYGSGMPSYEHQERVHEYLNLPWYRKLFAQYPTQ